MNEVEFSVPLPSFFRQQLCQRNLKNYPVNLQTRTNGQNKKQILNANIRTTNTNNNLMIPKRLTIISPKDNRLTFFSYFNYNKLKEVVCDATISSPKILPDNKDS